MADRLVRIPCVVYSPRMSKIAVALVAVTLAVPAHAYLDPGTGSILLQSLIGAIAVAAAAVATGFGHIRAFFTRKGSTKASDGGDRGTEP